MKRLWPALCVSTALALSLGACADAAKVSALPSYQQQRLENETRLASIKPMAGPATAERGIVLLRRTEPVVRPPSPEQLEAKVRRLADAVVAEREDDILRKASANNAEYARRISNMTTDQLQALREETEHQLALMEKQSQIYAKQAELNASKIAYTQADQKTAATEARLHEQIALRNQMLSTQITALGDVNAAHAAYIRQRVEDLTGYADEQIAALAEATSSTIARVAAKGQMDVAVLREKTANRLEELQQEATRRAVILTQQTEEKLAQKVAMAQADAEKKRLKPDQVKQIAQVTVQESAPELRALALQTLADSQDYIRTVATNAVRSGDPDMKLALKEAARDVITKDDRIVFAIRKVVDKRLERLPLSGAGYEKSLSPPPSIYNGEEVTLESDRLGIAPIGGTPAAVEPAAGPQMASLGKASMMRARASQDWIDLRKYRVVLHEDSKTLKELVGGVVARAEPYTGPWEIKWKIDRENEDILKQKFSLDAETTFEEFVNYLANYMVNERGVKLSFSLFDSERVLVISD